MGTKTPWNTLDLARILRPLSTSWQTQNLNISYRRPVLPAEGGKVGITLSDFFSWTLPRCAYGFLMNFSGLPEQSVAMLSFWLREKVRFIESSGWGRATELTLYVFGSMTVIVLVTICLVACDFLLYVLFQWTRETKRRPASRSAIGDEAGKAGQKKQPYIVGSRRAAEQHDRTAVVPSGSEHQRRVARP